MLAVLGHTTVDLVDGAAPRAGGAPLYAARALAALGAPAVIVTRCAAADEHLLAPLRATGVPVVWHPGPCSPVFRLRYDGEGRREVAIEELAEPWTTADVEGWLGEALAGVDWVHAGALWRGEFPPETLAALARGRRLSLEGQGLVRPGRLGPVAHDGAYDPATLAPVDVLHLSEREAAALGVSLDGPSLAALGPPEVVVTLGEHGSVVWAGGRAAAVPARTVRGADPTGAGDAFMAAYLVLRRGGRTPVEAAEGATATVRGLLSGTSG